MVLFEFKNLALDFNVTPSPSALVADKDIFSLLTRIGASNGKLDA